MHAGGKDGRSPSARMRLKRRCWSDEGGEDGTRRKASTRVEERRRRRRRCGGWGMPVFKGVTTRGGNQWVSKDGHVFQRGGEGRTWTIAAPAAVVVVEEYCLGPLERGCVRLVWLGWYCPLVQASTLVGCGGKEKEKNERVDEGESGLLEQPGGGGVGVGFGVGVPRGVALARGRRKRDGRCWVPAARVNLPPNTLHLFQESKFHAGCAPTPHPPTRPKTHKNHVS